MILSNGKCDPNGKWRLKKTIRLGSKFLQYANGISSKAKILFSPRIWKGN